MRALHLAARHLEEPDKSYIYDEQALIHPDPARVSRDRRERARPQMAGNSWSKQEDEELREDFHKGLSIAGIAKKHQRTQGAIRSRLLRLGIGIIGVIDNEKAIPRVLDTLDDPNTHPF